MKFADRVKETTTTTGTGPYSLEGAKPGFRTFVAGVGSGEIVPYMVTDGADWEVGVGVVTDATPDTLSRVVILSSSNGGVAVNWGAGSKIVVLTFPATMIVDRIGNNTLTGTNTFNQQIVSAIITGTSPLAVASTTVCTNLNADMCDGQHLGTNNTPQFAGLGLGTTVSSDRNLDLLRTVTSSSPQYGAISELDFTESANSIPDSGAVIGTIRFRGSNGNTSGQKGPSAFIGSCFVYDTGTTGNAQGFYLDIRNLGTGTVTHLAGAKVPTISNSGGGTITNTYGLKVEAQTAGTNNYGVWSNIAAATGRWNVYCPGTADNYFAGNVILAATTGNLLIGSSVTAGTNLATGIVLKNGTAPSSYPHVQIWADTGELKVADTSGNVTTLSPHAEDGPEELYDESPGIEWVIPHINVFTGEIRWHNMTRVAKQMPQLGPALIIETFDEYNARRGLVEGDPGYLVQIEWEAHEEALEAAITAKIQELAKAKADHEAAELAKVKASEKARLDWGTKPGNNPKPELYEPQPYVEAELPPSPYQKRSKPAWLK